MRKLLALTLVSSSLFMSQAYAVCVNSATDIPAPNDTVRNIHLGGARINGTVYNLDIEAWKFSCSESDNIGLAVSVENIGTEAIDFKRDELSYAGSGLVTIAPGEKFYHVTEDGTTGNLKNTATGIQYQFMRVVVPSYSGEVGGVDSKLSATAGLWYDPSLDGTGFNFIDTPSGMLAYYYGYDKNGGKNWLMTTKFGPKVGEAVVKKAYELSLNEPAKDNGGSFSQKPTGETSGTTGWGSMTLTFENCNEATAVLDGTDGKQTFNLVKLISNAGSDCSIEQ